MQQLVGNKAKGRISKLVLQENKVCKLFRKTNISFTLIRTRTYQGVRIIQLGKQVNNIIFQCQHLPEWGASMLLSSQKDILNTGRKLCLFVSTRFKTAVLDRLIQSALIQKQLPEALFKKKLFLTLSRRLVTGDP